MLKWSPYTYLSSFHTAALHHIFIAERRRRCLYPGVDQCIDKTEGRKKAVGRCFRKVKTELLQKASTGDVAHHRIVVMSSGSRFYFSLIERG